MIDRRILVNFRVDPEVLARVLPRPFRPHLVGGFGMAGICLIRLSGIGPRWLPRFVGLGSENAAHRISVEWDDGGTTRRGVYIPRRDSSSLWNALAGGRLFPGVHHHSRFQVAESNERYDIEVTNADGTRIVLEADIGSDLYQESIFSSLADASDFFAQGSIGYSATQRAGVYDGLQMCASRWQVEPLAVRRVVSSFFFNESVFPAGSVEFDCALLMRNIPLEWRGLATLECAACGSQQPFASNGAVET
jgi:hypothetical protein